MVAAHVTAADTSDRDGAVELLRRLDWRALPRLRHGWVDAGYRGAFLDRGRSGFGLHLEVVRRADGGRARRWLPPDMAPPVVPRFAGLPVCRGAASLGRGADLCLAGPVSALEQGLSKLLPATSQAAIYLAMCQVLTRRLAPRAARPSAPSGSHAGAAAR